MSTISFCLSLLMFGLDCFVAASTRGHSLLRAMTSVVLLYIYCSRSNCRWRVKPAMTTFLRLSFTMMRVFLFLSFYISIPAQPVGFSIFYFPFPVDGAIKYLVAPEPGNAVGHGDLSRPLRRRGGVIVFKL
jgi:hypothetical protein